MRHPPVGVRLTDDPGYAGTSSSGYVSIPPNTTVAAAIESNGALTLAFSSPVFYSPTFAATTGAFFSSATFNNGVFTEVKGAVSILGVPIGHKSTSSPFLLNKLNSQEALKKLANTLQNAATVLQKALNCADIAGNQ